MKIIIEITLHEDAPQTGTEPARDRQPKSAPPVTPKPPPPAAMPFKARGGYTLPFAHRNSPQPPVRKIKLTRERRNKVRKALHAIVGWSEYRESKGWHGGLRYAQIMEACQFFSLNPITLRRKP